MKIEENENSNLVMFGVQLALANSVGFATSSILGDRSKYLIPLILHNQQLGKETKDLEQSAFTKFKEILQDKEEGILRFNLVRKHKHFDFRIYYNQLPTYSTELMLFPIGGKAVIDQVVNGAIGRVTNLEDIGYYVFDVDWEENDTFQDYEDNLESYTAFLFDILEMLSEYNITYNPGSSIFEGTYKDKLVLMVSYTAAPAIDLHPDEDSKHNIFGNGSNMYIFPYDNALSKDERRALATEVFLNQLAHNTTFKVISNETVARLTQSRATAGSMLTKREYDILDKVMEEGVYPVNDTKLIIKTITDIVESGNDKSGNLTEILKLHKEHTNLESKSKISRLISKVKSLFKF